MLDQLTLFDPAIPLPLPFADDAFDAEVWRDVPGFVGYYSVSNWGRVRREKTNKGTRAGRILRAGRHPAGYIQITLSGGGVQREVLVHVLVAEAFLEPRGVASEVNHDDGNKANNRVGNLLWVTPKQNSEHAWRTGLSKPHGQKGTASSGAKLNDAAVRFIRASTARQSELARRFHVSQTTIYNIVLRNTWTHV